MIFNVYCNFHDSRHRQSVPDSVYSTSWLHSVKNQPLFFSEHRHVKRDQFVVTTLVLLKLQSLDRPHEERQRRQQLQHQPQRRVPKTREKNVLALALCHCWASHASKMPRSQICSDAKSREHNAVRLKVKFKSWLTDTIDSITLIHTIQILGRWIPTILIQCRIITPIIHLRHRLHQHSHQIILHLHHIIQILVHIHNNRIPMSQRRQFKHRISMKW